MPGGAGAWGSLRAVRGWGGACPEPVGRRTSPPDVAAMQPEEALVGRLAGVTVTAVTADN